MSQRERDAVEAGVRGGMGDATSAGSLILLVPLRLVQLRDLYLAMPHAEDTAERFFIARGFNRLKQLPWLIWLIMVN